MPSPFLLKNIRVEVCQYLCQNRGPWWWLALGASPGALGVYVRGRTLLDASNHWAECEKNATLGRTKQPHYALIVKLVSSAFS